MSWFCCQRSYKAEEKECQLQQDKALFLSKLSVTIDQNTRRSVKSNNNHQTSDHFINIPYSKEANKASKEIVIESSNRIKQNQCSIYEDYHNHPSPALPGLHCDLIDNNYYIGQTINSSLIEQFNLVHLFKEKQISLIVNLQLPFESQNCSMIEEIDNNSGYNYIPAIFSSQGICVSQSGFKEGSIPDLPFEPVLKIIREIAYTVQIEQKKIYLHSHLGLGRTCLIMVCYKIFTENSTTDSAYQFIKKQRQGSFLNDGQISFCRKFEQMSMNLNVLFPEPRKDIGLFIKNQIGLSIYPLSIDIENSTLFIPKILRVCLSRILILQKKLNVPKMEIYNTLNGSFENSDTCNKEINNIISKLKASDYSLIEESDSIMIITEVLYYWLNKSVLCCIEPSKIAQIFEVKIDNKTIDTLIGKDLVLLNEIKIKEIQSIIFNSLNKVEYEIFKYVSWFISHLLPLLVEETEAYDKMIEKLSIHLIGYNTEMLIVDNSNNNHYYPHYRKVISQAISLLKLFISSEVFNEKSDINHKNWFPFGACMLYLQNMNNVSSMGDTDKESSPSVNGMSVNEYRLYEMYYSLKNRFEPNEIKKQNNKQPISSKLRKKKGATRNTTTNVTFSNNNLVYKG